jgi:hypothetical protein
MRTLPILLSLLLAACGARRSNPNWQLERDAQPSQTHPYAGFWKIKPQQQFGLGIGPAGKDLYYVSFCGPGGCFAKGEYRPLTSLVADSSYHIVDTNQIEVNAKDGFTAFHRSDGRKGTKFIER